jgi:cytochrome c
MTFKKNLFVASLLVAASTFAYADLNLADSSACLNCHSVDKKLVGPAFKDISAKYKDRKDAAAYLSDKISKGSSGAWGTIAMPPMPSLPAKDVEVLTAWILKM